MVVLEKTVLSNEVIKIKSDIRGKPSPWQYIHLVGYFPAKKAERKKEPTILDSSTVKPRYFIGAWAIHLSALIVTISYIVYQANNYFQN